jgi:hypothetical protein
VSAKIGELALSYMPMMAQLALACCLVSMLAATV